MKIYIDFDGTLFDTDRYTKDFMHIFNDYGISKEIFDRAKKILFIDEKLFNINVIINYFIEKYNINIELKNKIDDFFNKSYVYSEVLDCLNDLINLNIESLIELIYDK